LFIQFNKFVLWLAQENFIFTICSVEWWKIFWRCIHAYIIFLMYVLAHVNISNPKEIPAMVQAQWLEWYMSTKCADNDFLLLKCHAYMYSYIPWFHTDHYNNCTQVVNLLNTDTACILLFILSMLYVITCS